MEGRSVDTPLNKRGKNAAWIGLAIAGLTAAVALKIPCETHSFVAGRYAPHCYSDIEPLFSVRQIAEGAVPYQDVPLEYPVVIGTVMWTLGTVSGGSGVTFFWLNAVVLAAAALAAAAIMGGHLQRSRLAAWAIGPPLVLYAFVNWDLLAVAPGLAGIAAFLRRRNGWAGAALGLGASAKLFPGLLLPVFLLARLREKDRPGAGRLAGGFLMSAALVNLPWLVAAPGGWWGVWRFHARRYPEWESAWYWVLNQVVGRFPFPLSGADYLKLVRIAAPLLFVAAAILILRKAWRVSADPVRVSLAVTLCFFLASTIYSPQYALWLVPLLLWAGTPWRLVGAFLGADLAVFFVRFAFFRELAGGGGDWLPAYEVTALLRLAVLGVVMFWAVRNLSKKPAPEGVG